MHPKGKHTAFYIDCEVLMSALKTIETMTGMIADTSKKVSEMASSAVKTSETDRETAELFTELCLAEMNKLKVLVSHLDYLISEDDETETDK